MGPLLLAIACSGNDSNVSFDPVGGSDAGGTDSGGSDAGGTKAGTAGSKTQGGTSAGGRGGTSSSGSDAGGTDTGGTSSGGTDAGGTDAGGTNAGGTGMAGTDAGGTGNAGTGAGGSSMGGSSAGTSMGGSSAGTSMGGSSAGTSMGGSSAGTSMGGTNSGGTGGSGGGMGGSSSCVPSPEVCDGVDNDCDKGIDQGDTCPTGCTGATFQGHTYVFCGAVASGMAAWAKCQDLHLGVVMIGSEVENTFVAGNIKGATWLGATDQAQEKRWIWYATGEVFWNDKEVDGKFNNWADGQPNNKGKDGAEEDCAIMNTAAATKGQWNDVDCASANVSVACESLDPVP